MKETLGYPSTTASLATAPAEQPVLQVQHLRGYFLVTSAAFWLVEPLPFSQSLLTKCNAASASRAQKVTRLIKEKLRHKVKVAYDSFDGFTAQLLTLLKNVPRCFPFLYLLFTKSFTILCETWTIKRQQIAKMNDRVPKERLGTSRLNHVFLKVYSYDPTSKFQE